MSFSLYKHLILKDLALLQKQLLAYGILGLVAVGIMMIPHEAFAHLGSMLLVTAIIAFYCHIIMKCIIAERKDKNELFIRTLPVTPFTIACAKLITCTAVIFVYWAVFFMLVIGLISQLPAWPSVALAFYCALFSSFLPGFAIVIFVALTKGSEGWTILTLVCSNILVTIGINAFPNTEAMQAGYKLGSMEKVGIIWPAITNQVLLFESGAAILLLALTLYIISRKREFT